MRQDSYPWIRKIFLDEFLRTEDWSHILIMADWCEEYGEEKRAEFWRWLVITQRIPGEMGTSFKGIERYYAWWGEIWSSEEGSRFLEDKLFHMLPTKHRSWPRHAFREYSSPFTAYVALEWAWMRSH